MDDNKNQNQSNQNISDYQKILDDYAASVKPEADEVQADKTDENVSASLQEAAPAVEDKPINIKTENTLTDALEKEMSVTAKPAATENPLNPELKSVHSPQLESPIHPSLANNLEANDEPIKTPLQNSLPPLPNNPVVAEPPHQEKSPEEIKAEINKLLSDDNNSESSSVSAPSAPKSGAGRVFFVFALILFLAIIAGLAYYLFVLPSSSDVTDDNLSVSATPTISEDNSETCELNNETYQVGESFASSDGCNTCTCSSAGVITCTEKACATTITSTTKTDFQKMVTDFTSYKDITATERNSYFPSSSSDTSFWPSYVKSDDELYTFTQKLIKGSIKKVVINKSKLSTITGNYSYTFYLTPNYQSWSNQYFSTLENQSQMIGDLSPVYAYSDKLIWSTSLNCGGIAASDTEECELLVKEIQTAFP